MSCWFLTHFTLLQVETCQYDQIIMELKIYRERYNINRYWSDELPIIVHLLKFLPCLYSWSQIQSLKIHRRKQVCRCYLRKPTRYRESFRLWLAAKLDRWVWPLRHPANLAQSFLAQRTQGQQLIGWKLKISMLWHSPDQIYKGWYLKLINERHFGIVRTSVWIIGIYGLTEFWDRVSPE